MKRLLLVVLLWTAACLGQDIRANQVKPGDFKNGTYGFTRICLNGTCITSWPNGSGETTGPATWGEITGDITAQTDLQLAFNAKLDTSQFNVAGVSALWTGSGACYLKKDGSCDTPNVSGTLAAYTVSTLPSAASNLGKMVIVTDGNADRDCTTGGGTTKVLCQAQYNVWVSPGYFPGVATNGNGKLTLAGATLTGTPSANTDADTVGARNTAIAALPVPSNDATLGGSSPSATAPPTQSAVQAYWAAHALSYTPEQQLTFSPPLQRSSNTITIDLSNYVTASVLAGYAPNSALAQSKTCTGTDKISGYDSASHQFTCTADQTTTGGTGITSINGATVSSQTLAGGSNVSVTTNTSTGTTTIALSGMAAVATSGAYTDLSGKPVLPVNNAGTAHQFFCAFNSTTGVFSGCSILASDVPTLNQNTTGNAATATALSANGSNCSAGTIPLGVDASGNAEGCYAPTASLVGLGSVTNNVQTKDSIVPNTFTGIRKGNNGTVDTAASSADLQAVIGSGVYDASGAAAAKANPGSCTLPNVVTATTTGGVTCQQPTNVTGTAANITASTNNTLTSIPNLALGGAQITSGTVNAARLPDLSATYETVAAAISALALKADIASPIFTGDVTTSGGFISTDSVNNGYWDFPVGSGGDTTCPAAATGHVILCNRNNQLQVSNNGAAYAAPGSTISLTTTGTSGAATLSSGTLNIPQYQGALTLTTTGSSGAATLSGGTLNIPQYTGSTFPGFTNAPDPTATVAAGTYSSTQTVSFQCSMGIVACGIAGQAPLASCTNISVSATSTYSAMCWELGLIPKTPATFAYTISSSAPTYGGATSMTQVASPSSPITYNHTLTSGATALIVSVAMDTAGSDVSTIAVTYNGVAMTLLGSKESGTDASGNGRVYMFAMTSPASGTHAVSISYTGTGPEHCESTAVDFLSAGMPTLAGSSNGQLVTNPSITVTGTTGHLNLAAYTSGSAAGTIMQGTQVASSGTVSNGAAGFLTSARQNGAASVTFQYPTNSDWYAYVVADIPGN